jgi:hypothetical protein
MTNREIISRKDAGERDLSVYFTGTACKRAGHFSARRVEDGICMMCMIAHKRAQMQPDAKPLSLTMHPARLAAERAGRLTFGPGYPCIHNHHAERYVGGRINCVECVRLGLAKRKAALEFAR